MANAPELQEAPKSDVLPKIGEPTPDRKKWHIKKQRGVIVFGISVFLVGWALGTLLLVWAIGWWACLCGLAIGGLAACSVHIAFEWERIVILRYGNYSRTALPGLYFTIPIIEQVVLHVDQRIHTTPFLNEHALTSDLAPVDVDAVVFWMVWDPKQAYTQVVDYPSAVSWSAQTALRDAIGRINLTDVPMKRQQIDHEVQTSLEQKVADWGISIISVEIRDIAMPEDLQNAMSRAAQAERERDARIILAEAEKEASNMFVEAAESYKDNETALQLRMANLLYESVKDSGSMVVVPSVFSESASVIEKTCELLKKM